MTKGKCITILVIVCIAGFLIGFFQDAINAGITGLIHNSASLAVEPMPEYNAPDNMIDAAWE